MRAEKQSEDELGSLIDAFNEMLNQIQHRDAALIRARDELEERVLERTKELADANAHLQIEVEERHAAERALQKANRGLADSNTQLETALRELKEAESQLIQAEKLSSIGQMVAGVAHEMNNPLGAVKSSVRQLADKVAELRSLLGETPETLIGLYAAVLQDREDEVASGAYVPGPEAAPFLARLLPPAKAMASSKRRLRVINEFLEDLPEEIQLSSDRLVKIVQDLRTFVRLDQAEESRFDLNECVESAFAMAKHTKHPNVEVKLDLGEGLESVTGSPRKLAQVFLNLMVNAFHAMPGGGTLRIASRREGEAAIIEVADTGIGISPEVIPKIFDPFFTTKPVGKGTGLGLSVSYGIVQDHGGEIKVDSEAGRGSVFTVRIPVQRAQGDGHVGHQA
ncbi:MAG: hypothetical protein K8I02_05945 [Candidatus Methylomirabilis sp.]|nr:hypothetical protein [Deltaproteobacteria bacterium]